MNQRLHKSKMLLVFFILIMLLVLMVTMMTGCQVLKGKQRTAVDSVSVAKVDTGAVSKTNIDSKNEWEWWKTTFKYAPPDAGDTIINHNYYTNNLPRPSVVVIEGGKGSKQTAIQTYDSSWKKAFDSLSYKLEQTSKSKETKVMSPFQIIALCMGGCIILLFITKVLGKYSLVKN